MIYKLYVWEIITYTLITIISSLIYMYFKYQEKNELLRLFVPKNDSLWERLKVLLTPFLFIKIIEIIFTGFNVNVLFACFMSLIFISVVNPAVFLLIFSNTKYDMIVQNLITNITSLLLSIILSIFIVSIQNLPVLIGYVCILGIFMFIFFFIIATYYQTDDYIFIDPNLKKNKLKKDS